MEESRLRTVSTEDMEKLGCSLREKIDKFILSKDLWDEGQRNDVRRPKTTVSAHVDTGTHGDIELF